MKPFKMVLPHSFIGQHQLVKSLNKFCFGDESIEMFRISEYDDCRITMMDAVDARVQELSEHILVRAEFAYVETISDDPSCEITIVRSMSELGEIFDECFHRKHVLYNFITERPDPEMTVQDFKANARRGLISPEEIQWIEAITDPLAMEAKRLLVYHKLAGQMQNGWLRVVDNLLDPVITGKQF